MATAVITDSHSASFDNALLDYREVDVYCIYGFEWWPTNPLRDGAFVGDGDVLGKGWIAPLIHERVLSRVGGTLLEGWVGVYQPTLVLNRRCLEQSGEIRGNKRRNYVQLVVPLANDASLRKRGRKQSLSKSSDHVLRSDVRLFWTIRLFDTGSGTITVRICPLGIRHLRARAQRFALLQQLLRLVPNMDLYPEAHVVEDHPNLPVADSFLFIPGTGACRLYEVALTQRDAALKTLPVSLFRSSTDLKPRVIADDSGFAYSRRPSKTLQVHKTYGRRSWRESQTPFVFTSVVVSNESMGRLKQPSLITPREIASICARLTLDNRYIIRDFERLSDAYLRQAFGYRGSPGVLPTLSHDDRLFLAFSKRGAVAITSAPQELPAVFLLPSIVNLLEIVRSRLVLGVLLGAELASIARQLSVMNFEQEEIVKPEGYAVLRTRVITNLQDPLEYLFDGGSLSEIAIRAQRDLGIREIWRNVRQSFDIVDRLIASRDAARFRWKYGGIQA